MAYFYTLFQILRHEANTISGSPEDGVGPPCNNEKKLNCGVGPLTPYPQIHAYLNKTVRGKQKSKVKIIWS